MTDETEVELTERAQRALATYLNSQRETVIGRAKAASFSRTGRIEVDASDILASITSSDDRAAIEQVRSEALSKREISRSRILLLFQLYGRILIISGVFLVFYEQFRYTLESISLIGLSIAGAGAIITFAGSQFLEYWTLRASNIDLMERSRFARQLSEEVETALVARDFLDTWTDLERAARLVAAERSELKSERLGLRSIMAKIGDSEAIRQEDLDDFSEALRIRNLIAHGHPPKTWDELEELRSLRIKMADLTDRLAREI